MTAVVSSELIHLASPLFRWGFVLCVYIAPGIGVINMHISLQLFVLFQQLLLEGLLLYELCLLKDHLFPHEPYLLLDGRNCWGCLLDERKWRPLAGRKVQIQRFGHVSTEYAIFSAFWTGALGKLHTYWTQVWMAYDVRGPFSESFGRMRSETAIFPRFLRAGFATLPCELDPRTNVTSFRKVLVRWVYSLVLKAGSPYYLLVVGSWIGGSDSF
ncbi:hypothetical protein PVK06_028045 [Gossypium arboreum]|uniref:Wax synthase domain-containing protein n=1 Tax=Gossypium arboreum TaxID=29729 RepID=A0ABR0P3A4_GOSAR|nr:hypothetical protein PVK06_028045 [Gossypium arboreum]